MDIFKLEPLEKVDFVINGMSIKSGNKEFMEMLIKSYKETHGNAPRGKNTIICDIVMDKSEKDFIKCVNEHI